jgi:hypothetical protein
LEFRFIPQPEGTIHIDFQATGGRPLDGNGKSFAPFPVVNGALPMIYFNDLGQEQVYRLGDFRIKGQ